MVLEYPSAPLEPTVVIENKRISNLEHHTKMETLALSESRWSVYPEVILNAGLVTLGKKLRKKMCQSNKRKAIDQRDEICSSVCALLNSGGGIVVVESEDKNFRYSGLEPDIEPKLVELITSLTAQDYYDYIQIESYLMIFVKTWSMQNRYPKLCTLDTGLWVRSSSQKKKANCMQVLELAERKTKGRNKKARYSTCSNSLVEKLLQKPVLCLGEKLDISEDEYIEFKDYSTDKNIERVKEDIKPYFSAFGNNNGGYLIIGVDDEATVKGCCKNYSESEVTTTLKTLIEKEIQKMTFFHFKDCEINNDCLYTLTLKPVGNKDGYVIFIEIKPFCCLAFSDDPWCWVVDSQTKEKRRMTASEWMKTMTSDQCFEHSLEKEFGSLTIKETSPLGKRVYNKGDLNTLHNLLDNLFGSLEDGVIIKPDEVYSELKAEHPEIERLLHTVVPKATGILILSRSWAVDLEQSSYPRVICDALLLVAGEHPKLYSVVEDTFSKVDLEYSRNTAFALKQQLVYIGGYTEKLCVIPAVLQLKFGNESTSWSHIEYPDKYKLEDLDTVRKLLRSISIVMLHFRSFFSDIIGVEYFNLLTAEQYKVMCKRLQNFGNGPLFIHGPAGTGKTVLAMKIITRIKNTFNCTSDNILYICENTPLRDYIQSKRICQAMTRNYFARYDYTEDIKHIVVDEAQNFQLDDINWYEKAKSIVEKTGSRGAFYIFLDNFQSCHIKDTGLPPYTQQNKYILKKVVRSPEKIYKHILCAMERIAYKSSSLRSIVKKSKCGHGVTGEYTLQNMTENDIVQDIARACKKYICEGYSQGDIAILCTTMKEITRYRFLLEDQVKLQTKKLRTTIKPFSSAEDIMKDVVIVDSVRRFSGLERRIIFAINPISKISKINDNIFLCAAARATAKLHVYYEVKTKLSVNSSTLPRNGM